MEKKLVLCTTSLPCELAGTGIYGPLIGTLPKKNKRTNVDLQPWFQKDQRTGQRTYPEPPDVCRYSLINLHGFFEHFSKP